MFSSLFAQESCKFTIENKIFIWFPKKYVFVLCVFCVLCVCVRWGGGYFFILRRLKSIWEGLQKQVVKGEFQLGSLEIELHF